MADTPPITVESLLAETDWLRALARQLIRDQDRAEDLFQETVLASLRDRGSVRGELRPWLSRVARNLAAKTHRTEVRRERRERAAARRDVHVDARERFEMHRTVVEAVQTLEEPYQTAVLLRYFEDLPPREIASRLDVPVETVKTRLKRGMQLLRTRLDREHGDRSTWIAAFLPALDLGEATAGATTGVAGVSFFALLPTKALLSAAALLLAGVLGVTFFDGFGEQAPEMIDVAGG